MDFPSRTSELVSVLNGRELLQAALGVNGSIGGELEARQLRSRTGGQIGETPCLHRGRTRGETQAICRAAADGTFTLALARNPCLAQRKTTAVQSSWLVHTDGQFVAGPTDGGLSRPALQRYFDF